MKLNSEIIESIKKCSEKQFQSLVRVTENTLPQAADGFHILFFGKSVQQSNYSFNTASNFSSKIVGLYDSLACLNPSSPVSSSRFTYLYDINSFSQNC